MEFEFIKSVVQRALASNGLSDAEADAVRSTVMMDSNQERAHLLVELLGLDSQGAFTKQ